MNIPGDLSQEDYETDLMKQVRDRIGAAGTTGNVILTASEARFLFDQAGGSFEKTEDEKDEPTDKEKFLAATATGVGVPTKGPEQPTKEAEAAARARAGTTPQAAAVAPSPRASALHDDEDEKKGKRK
jgi:hypothetical protein